MHRCCCGLVILAPNLTSFSIWLTVQSLAAVVSFIPSQYLLYLLLGPLEPGGRVLEGRDCPPSQIMAGIEAKPSPSKVLGILTSLTPWFSDTPTALTYLAWAKNSSFIAPEKMTHKRQWVTSLPNFSRATEQANGFAQEPINHRIVTERSCDVMGRTLRQIGWWDNQKPCNVFENYWARESGKTIQDIIYAYRLNEVYVTVL